MNKSDRALLQELYRVMAATAMQVEKIRVDLSLHTQDTHKDIIELHTDILQKPTEKPWF